MRGSARLDDRQAAVALAGLHQVVKLDPGICEGGDLQRGVGLLALRHFVEQAGAQQGDAFRLGPVDQELRNAVCAIAVVGFRPGRHRIDDHAARAHVRRECLDADQIACSAPGYPARGNHAQAAAVQMGGQTDADR